MRNLILCFLTMNFIFISCDCEMDDPNLDKPGGEDSTKTVVAFKYLNLPADPGTGFDPNTGAPLGTTGLFTLFSLADSSVIDNKDSASLKWDIGFRGSRIILNGGTSGPGTVSAFIQSGIFGSIDTVNKDSIFKIDQAPVYVIGSTWATYDPVKMINAPTLGKTIILKTNQSKYAKIEILSYYKDAPAAPDAKKDLPRYYTFQYVLQRDGTTKLK